jgi:hypothetical protein
LALKFLAVWHLIYLSRSRFEARKCVEVARYSMGREAIAQHKLSLSLAFKSDEVLSSRLFSSMS